MKLVLYFEDLQKQGLINNWTTLNRWIRELGFPEGHMTGRRRVWTPDEVTAWIKRQPGDKREPRGICKDRRDAAAREAA